MINHICRCGFEIKFNITPAAEELIVESGFDPAFGARPLKRAVIRELETPVSRLLISGELLNGGTLKIDAVDGKPVDLVFLLISPESSGADHLTALASLSRCLKDESICERLRQMNNPTEIYALLCEA